MTLATADRLFVTRRIPDSAMELLASAMPALQIRVNEFDRNLDRHEIITGASGASALICTLADPIDRTLIDSLPSLRVVATFAVGTNNIDLEAARARKLVVTNTPGALTQATAEVAVALILACSRRLAEGDALTRRGGFQGWAPLFMRGRGVFGKTVGIVGAGRIGTCVARTMALGFDCRVVYAARKTNPELEQSCSATKVDFETLMRESDFVSLHCPLTPDTRHLVDARALSLMKPNAYLINTARGPIIDEAALVEALKARRIAGAGLDVYESEPELAPGLAELDNVVLLPHLGSATIETRDKMGLMCAQSVIDVLRGREPKHRVA